MTGRRLLLFKENLNSGRSTLISVLVVADAEQQTRKLIVTYDCSIFIFHLFFLQKDLMNSLNQYITLSVNDLPNRIANTSHFRFSCPVFALY